MKDHDVVYEIERAAWRANVSVRRLCELAGVSYTTFWRWKQGTHSPLHENVQLLLAKAAELEKQNKFMR